jgi:hypothetical protein
VGGAVVLFSVWQKIKNRKAPGLYKAKAVLTPNETEFYLRLKRALPRHIVLAQVSMGALIQPGISSRENNQEFFKLRATFAQKIVDYVVCDAELNVLALVELDDKMHDKQKDAKRDAMTRAAGYTTLRFESRRKPTEAEIASYF